MKVLVVHNLYRSEFPSGENTAVRDDIDRLRRVGVEVETLLPTSDDITGFGAAGRLSVAAGPLVNPIGVRRFTALLRMFGPDVVHIHNVFPIVSPWVIRVACSAGVPVVQTVHNYRHTCVSGCRYREGAPCDDCLGRRVPLPAIWHGCYRGSRVQTLPMVASAVVHRPTWRRVDAFIALTDFMAAQLVEAGIDRAKIVVFPTAAPDPGPTGPPGRNVLFVGRLEEMKGPDLLVDAWPGVAAPAGARLRIGGTGPLMRDLAARARPRDGIDVLGRLDPEDVADEMRKAALVAIPSRWYEGQPKVLIEAFAHGRGVLGSNTGAMSTLGVDGLGWSVPPRVDALRSALAVLRDRKTLCAVAGRARARYEQTHTDDRLTTRLVELYVSLTGRARRPGT